MQFANLGNLPRVRKAAKPHECDGCEADIRINEYYACQSHAHGPTYGPAYSSEKLCLPCYRQQIERYIVRVNQQANALIDEAVEHQQHNEASFAPRPGVIPKW